MNRYGRKQAIWNLVHGWIGEDGFDMGRVIETPSFYDLYLQVSQLDGMGRSEAWLMAIRHWRSLVKDAEKQFVIETELTSTVNYDECSFEVKKTYARLFKHAVTFGAIEAGLAA